MEWNPGGRRRRERPRSRWMIVVEADMREIGIKGWKEKN